MWQSHHHWVFLCIRLPHGCDEPISVKSPSKSIRGEALYSWLHGCDDPIGEAMGAKSLLHRSRSRELVFLASWTLFYGPMSLLIDGGEKFIEINEETCILGFMGFCDRSRIDGWKWHGIDKKKARIDVIETNYLLRHSVKRSSWLFDFLIFWFFFFFWRIWWVNLVWLKADPPAAWGVSSFGRSRPAAIKNLRKVTKCVSNVHVAIQEMLQLLEAPRVLGCSSPLSKWIRQPLRMTQSEKTTSSRLSMVILNMVELRSQLVEVITFSLDFCTCFHIPTLLYNVHVDNYHE